MINGNNKPEVWIFGDSYSDPNYLQFEFKKIQNNFWTNKIENLYNVKNESAYGTGALYQCNLLKKNIEKNYKNIKNTKLIFFYSNSTRFENNFNIPVHYQENVKHLIADPQNFKKHIDRIPKEWYDHISYNKKLYKEYDYINYAFKNFLLTDSLHGNIQHFVLSYICNIAQYFTNILLFKTDSVCNFTLFNEIYKFPNNVTFYDTDLFHLFNTKKEHETVNKFRLNDNNENNVSKNKWPNHLNLELHDIFLEDLCLYIDTNKLNIRTDLYNNN